MKTPGLYVDRPGLSSSITKDINRTEAAVELYAGIKIEHVTSSHLWLDEVSSLIIS